MSTQVRLALDDGVNVGLGVDGSASNDAGNLLHEARLACFLQRAGGNVAGAVHDAQTMGNDRAVAFLSSCDQVGRLPACVRKNP